MPDNPTIALPPYVVEVRARVKKRIHLELDKSGNLVVVAPPHWTGQQIAAALQQNALQVERFLVRARRQHLRPLQYVRGEAHFFLGEHYPLAVDAGPSNKPRVTLAHDRLNVRVRRSDPTAVKRCLWNWYRKQAVRVFEERLHFVAKQATWTRDRQVSLQVRKMRRSWGNCSSSGLIKVNVHLVKAPLHLLDSVIAHELCHLLEKNHGRAFYALLEDLNPHWRSHRASLRTQRARYLLD